MYEKYIVNHHVILMGDNLVFNVPINKRLFIKLNKNGVYELKYDKNITLKFDTETFKKYIEPNIRLVK